MELGIVGDAPLIQTAITRGLDRADAEEAQREEERRWMNEQWRAQTPRRSGAKTKGRGGMQR